MFLRWSKGVECSTRDPDSQAAVLWPDLSQLTHWVIELRLLEGCWLLGHKHHKSCCLWCWTTSMHTPYVPKPFHLGNCTPFSMSHRTLRWDHPCISCILLAPLKFPDLPLYHLQKVCQFDTTQFAPLKQCCFALWVMLDAHKPSKQKLSTRQFLNGKFS